MKTILHDDDHKLLDYDIYLCGMTPYPFDKMRMNNMIDTLDPIVSQSQHKTTKIAVTKCG